LGGDKELDFCPGDGGFALADRIGRTTVSCQPRDVDRYGRIVAICFKGNEDLNRWMVANGWAVAFRRYSLDYVASEAAARRSEINIWSGNFDMPWDWRVQHQNR
jgi:endonuclease YncB( thermonuclease family)